MVYTQTEANRSRAQEVCTNLSLNHWQQNAIRICCPTTTTKWNDLCLLFAICCLLLLTVCSLPAQEFKPARVCIAKQTQLSHQHTQTSDLVNGSASDTWPSDTPTRPSFGGRRGENCVQIAIAIEKGPLLVCVCSFNRWASLWTAASAQFNGQWVLHSKLQLQLQSLLLAMDGYCT